jgi:protein-disulfide isomerase
VLEQNPDTVKIVFKHFPLQSHRFSAVAALASYAAQQQGKFWQYHDLIFQNYKNLSNESFVSFAEQLNLNLPLFNKHMNSAEAKEMVTNDYQDGRDAGVTATPTVFINGRRLQDRSLGAIQKIISEELK